MNMISKNELCRLIPHSGAMCLLDEVEYWDDSKIICRSKTHLQDDNPLRKADQLSIVHGIEYGAQAMAVHGGLLARQSSLPVLPAYLASLKHVRFFGQPMLSCDDNRELVVEAEKIYASEGSLVYTFCVKCEEIQLVSGEAMVIQPGEGV